jgi:hypothetical protein
VENETGFRSRRGRDQKETEGLTEDVLEKRSDIRECEEPKMEKGVGNRRHNKRNKAKKKTIWARNGK